MTIDEILRDIHALEEEALDPTNPHHKHIPPDIKHHRIPAPELSFMHPNLPVLIEEVERLLKT